MNNVIPIPRWDPIPELPTTAVLRAGPDGPLNLQAKAIANRLALLESDQGTTKIGHGGGTLAELLGAFSRNAIVVTAPPYNAKAGAAASVNVQAFDKAIQDAIAWGVRVIRVDGGNFNITGVSQDIHQVTLIGNGTVSGVYRKSVVRDLDGAWTASCNFSVDAHAPRLLSAKKPKVVLVGDSISAFISISSTDKSDNLEYMLRAKLREVCPHKEIQFVNRAVGGKRYYDLGRDDVADLSSASWYAANPGRPWMDYIKDEAPDVVFVSFGMNDGHLWDQGNFRADSTFAVVEKLRALPSRPDIVFCTNVLPSLSSPNPTYSSKEEQEGRDAIAGFTRSWAEVMGCGYLDFNRAANALRDGRDVMDCYLDRLDVNVNGDFPITSPVEARDYSLWFRINNYQEGYLDSELVFRLSSYKDNIFVLQTIGGKIRVVSYILYTPDKVYDEITDIPAPAPGSSPVFEFSLSRNRVELLMNGVAIFRGPVIRYGGSFVPKVAYTGATVASITSTLSVGVERAYKPRLSDYDIYRTEDGGNGINHMNAAGQRAMFSEVIDRAIWSAPAAFRVPAFHAQRLLRGHDGLAIDFATKQYVIQSEDAPALNRSGDPASIITMAMGAALEYVTDPASGATLGIRCRANLGYVPLNLLPNMANGFAVIVEAYQEVTGVVNFLFAMTRDAQSQPRLHARIMEDGTAKMATYADDSSISVNMSGQVENPLLTGRFNRYGFSFAVNDMKLVANGRRTYGRSAKYGVLPSALTRLRLGHDGSPLAEQSPVVIRSIVVIPRAVSHNELNALTF